MLAVDFDEGRPDRLQNLDADRLIVDEGASPSVGHLDATQNQVAVDVDIRSRRDEACGMVDGAVENSRDLALRFSMPDEASVASPTKSQRKGIEENRLASPRLTGEDGEALMEMELELVDEDDVANRKLDQHGR